MIKLEYIVTEELIEISDNLFSLSEAAYSDLHLYTERIERHIAAETEFLNGRYNFTDGQNIAFYLVSLFKSVMTIKTIRFPNPLKSHVSENEMAVLRRVSKWDIEYSELFQSAFEEFIEEMKFLNEHITISTTGSNKDRAYKFFVNTGLFE